MASLPIPAQLSVEASVYQGVQKSSNGYKLLESMGWTEGKGLGASGQGIREHITVKKKNDSLGIGKSQVEALDRNTEWLENMNVFDKMLSGLKEIKAGGEMVSIPEDKAASSRKTKKRKAHKTQSKSLKKKRTKVQEKKSINVDALKESQCKNKSRGKSVSHIGRFRRQEESKSVEKYSDKDLAAILGGAAVQNDQYYKRSEAASSGDDDRTKEELEKDCHMWWAERFVRAGTLQKQKRTVSVSKNIAKSSITVHGFSEIDQTNLCTQVQDAATVGKQGLGIASVKKVGGAKTGQGKRLVFSSDAEIESDTVGEDHPPANTAQISDPTWKSEETVHEGQALQPSSEQYDTKSELCTLKFVADNKIPASEFQADCKKPKCGLTDKKRIIVKCASKILKRNGGKLQTEKLCDFVMKKSIWPGSHKSLRLEIKDILETSKNIVVGKKFVRALA